ncbi:MAG: polysaccharide biosynthesis/export family protein, partial [Thermodesulfobacteriota bacterium]|nr:polysaccharide biosynthesis/export family protein [Thermodesulfobacteriota bacterium]
GAQKDLYLIGPSDRLDISVWGEADLSREVIVRSDGCISLPLAGDITAAGKTPPVLAADIESSLVKFIQDPHCAVILLEPGSKRVYIQGEVNHQGEFLITSTLSFTQAISLAGGFTQWADRNSIVVLRAENGKKIRIRVKYKDIIKGKKEDISIRPGDTIIIP